MNYKYILVFADQATCYSWVYLLRDRSAASVEQSIEDWLPKVQSQVGSPTVKYILADVDKEYLNCVAEFLKEHGIQ